MNLFLGSTTIPSSAFEHIQKLTGKETPRLGIIDIATKPYYEKNSSSDPAWVTRQFGDLENVGFKTIRYRYSDTNWINSLRNDFDKLDAIYLSGGNPFVLNHALKKLNLENIVKYYLENDKVVIGSSAGAVVFAQDIEIYSSLSDLSEAEEIINNGLGIFPYNLLVHWNNSKYQVELKKMEALFQEVNERNIIYVEDKELIYFDGQDIKHFK